MSTNRPASSAYGPASPTTSTSASASVLRRAGLDHRRRQRDHPADQDHRRPRDRRGRPARPRARRAATSAPAASSPATAGGTAPVASSDDHRGEDRERPLGARAERHRLPAHELGRVDDEHVGSSRFPSRARPRPLQQQRVADGEHALARPSSSPLRCTARTTRSPLSVTMPGNTALADQLGARRDHDLGDAGARVSSVVRGVVEPVLLDQRARVVAEVGARSTRGVRCGSSRSPNSTTIAIVAEHERDADERELEEPEAPDARVGRGVGDDHVDRRPGQRQQRSRRARRRPAASAAATAGARAGPPSRPRPAAAPRRRR